VTENVTDTATQTAPRIRTAGVDGMLVTFGDALSEPANRAALAFRAEIERQGWNGVEESATSLVSAYLRFDPLHLGHAELKAKLDTVLSDRDWYEAPLPSGRRLWRIPAVFGTDLGPQLDQAAEAAGVTPEQAIKDFTQTRVRVQTIGFAPGQPYLGELPEAWNIPRQSTLTSRIPEGALAVAIRQLVLFSVATPTGWQHIGQTAMRLFQPEADEPFLLRPGDEVEFTQTDTETLSNMRNDPHGGAERSDLP
jgi:inhibitor of KinA